MDSLNDFIYRGTRPKPMAVPSPKRISTPAGQRLSTILENQNATSPQPSNRAESQRFNFGTPPRASEERRPPSYASKEATVTDAERAAFAAEPRTLKERLSRRGGWKRLGLIVGGVLLVIIALAVGLGVGLNMNSGDKNSSGNGNGNAGNSLGPFPAGAWTFETFLITISTDCTSNPATWTCNPYSTYSETGAGSATSLNWVIKASSSDSNQFTISSSDNPWAPSFRDIPLTLNDANSPNEHYTFSIKNMSKQVLPDAQLTNDNSIVTCYFNSTSINASIYTRRPISLSPQARQPSMSQFPKLSNGQTYHPWKHAVEIDQISPGGPNSPQCYRTFNNNPVGAPIDLPSRPASSECNCVYKNFET